MLCRYIKELKRLTVTRLDCEADEERNRLDQSRGDTREQMQMLDEFEAMSSKRPRRAAK